MVKEGQNGAAWMLIPVRRLTILNKFANATKATLYDVIDNAKDHLEAAKDQEARSAGGWFTYRSSALLPVTKVLPIMIFSKGGTIDSEMHDSYDYFSSSCKPTPSAFVQARDAIPIGTFEEVFHCFTNRTLHLPGEGYIRMACDGSTIPFACMNTYNNPDYFVSGASSKAEDEMDAKEQPQKGEEKPASTGKSVAPPKKLSRQMRRAQERAKKKAEEKVKKAKAALENKKKREEEKKRKIVGNVENGDEKDEAKAKVVKGRAHNEAHLNVLHLSDSGVILDAVIQPVHKKDERSAFLQMAENLVSGPNHLSQDELQRLILSADRGYEGFHVVVSLQELGLHFLIRSKGPQVSSSMLYSLRRFLPSDSGEFDVDIDVTLVRKDSKKDELYDANPDTYVKITTQNFPECTKDHPVQFKIRVVRIDLDGKGNYEYLITNLPRDAFPMSSMKEEYFRRWPVETSNRFLKLVSGLAFLHAKKVDAVIKEIWAKLIMHNFCQVIIYQAVLQYAKKEHGKGKKYLYQINRSYATRITRKFARMRRFCEDLFFVIQQRTEPVRPGRQYARRKRPRYVRSFLYRVC